jgi:hypothetical protein
MPMTVAGRPLMLMPRPMTPSAPSKWVCHKPWLITVTSGAPAVSSSAVNSRPRVAPTPSVAK